MKKILFLAAFSLMALAAGAQPQTQTVGPLTVELQNTRVVGNRLIVTGKMAVTAQTRLRNIQSTAVTPEGDSHKLYGMVFAGQSTDVGIFDRTLEPNIPYSFDLWYDTNNQPINTLAALQLNVVEHNTPGQPWLRFSFPGVAVPMRVDPALKPGTFEIAKDVYMRWTRAEESAAGLVLGFVLENRSNREQSLIFISYDPFKFIDKDGNEHKGERSIADRPTLQPGVPMAGTITVRTPLKLADVLMMQFRTSNTSFAIRDFTMPK